VSSFLLSFISVSSHFVERIMISYQQLCSGRRLTGARVGGGGGGSGFLSFFLGEGGK